MGYLWTTMTSGFIARDDVETAGNMAICIAAAYYHYIRTQSGNLPQFAFSPDIFCDPSCNPNAES